MKAAVSPAGTPGGRQSLGCASPELHSSRLAQQEPFLMDLLHPSLSCPHKTHRNGNSCMELRTGNTMDLVWSLQGAEPPAPSPLSPCPEAGMEQA